MEELLKSLSDHLDEYARHREYIKRAQGQADRFSPAIIEKVVLDHEIKSSTVADEILALVPELEQKIRDIDDEISGIKSSKASSDEKMQELELRSLIGELTEEEFGELSADLRDTLDEANSRLEELGGDRERLTGQLDRWVELAASAGQADGTSAATLLVEEDTPELDAEPVAVLEAVEDEDSLISELVEDEGFDPVAAEPDGRHASYGGGREDLSTVLGDHDDEPVIATMEVDEELFVGSDVELESAEDSLDDVDGIAINISDVEGVEDELGSEDVEEQRRALLLYQEGTAEEQIYPFTNDVLTIGRGRDNDIQIKNDSKVSRFHCKLFRRSANFYIEDNKSSNGTLVNGELITERRLFGGEEIIIGETFFRFRIM